jgi:hypothetical protein
MIPDVMVLPAACSGHLLEGVLVQDGDGPEGRGCRVGELPRLD